MSKLLPDLSNTGNLAVIRQCCSLWRDFLCFVCTSSYFSLLHLVLWKGVLFSWGNSIYRCAETAFLVYDYSLNILYCAIQSLKVFGEKKYGVLLHFGLAAVWSILGNKEKTFVKIFIVAGFINQQVMWNTGTIFLFLNFCGTWDNESGEIRNEERKMNEWAPVAYRN